MREIINAFLIAAASLALLASAAACDKKDKFLRADPPSFEFDAQPQSETAMIESSSSWYPISNATWLDTYPDKDNPSLLHIVISEANESLSPREDEISIFSGEAMQLSIRVFQHALDASFEVSPSELLEIDGRGILVQTLTVTARNISEWVFDKWENWLEVTRGEGGEENVLTVRAAYSPLFEPRRDTIIIGVPRAGFEAINDTIPVVQRGNNLFLLENREMIEDIFEIAADVTRMEFNIASAYEWTLTVSGDAVPSAVSGAADTSGEENELIVTVPENTGAEAVEYLLTFECGGESYPFTIIQSAPGGGEEPLP